LARRPFVRTRSSRKGTDWSGSTPVTGFTAVAASTSSLLQIFTPIVGGETVIRIRGLLSVKTDQIAAAENQVGAYGICVVSEPAATVGITAVPTPMADNAWDGWMYHQYFAQAFQFSSAVGWRANLAEQVQIDCKAMRKVSENDRLVFVVENAAAFGIQLFDMVRILSKLH